MSSSIPQRLREIQKASKAELTCIWQEMGSSAVPPQLRRNIMIMVLAQKVQERALGPMRPELKAHLRQLAHSTNVNHTLSAITGPTLKPGSRLVRYWDGRNHIVTVEPEGFEYGGIRYDSLSQIARKITGTRWSGPLFFGLRRKRSTEVSYGK